MAAPRCCRRPRRCVLQCVYIALYFSVRTEVCYVSAVVQHIFLLQRLPFLFLLNNAPAYHTFLFANKQNRTTGPCFHMAITFITLTTMLSVDSFCAATPLVPVPLMQPTSSLLNPCHQTSEPEVQNSPDQGSLSRTSRISAGRNVLANALRKATQCSAALRSRFHPLASVLSRSRRPDL